MFTVGIIARVGGRGNTKGQIGGDLAFLQVSWLMPVCAVRIPQLRFAVCSSVDQEPYSAICVHFSSLAFQLGFSVRCYLN